MSRPVQIRVSYRNDAAFLLRLEDAVSKDERQEEVWRQETCAHIRQLATRLLQADGHPTMDDGVSRAAGKERSTRR
jgi:hypothetical protein